jgi:REP element-mobilizing transposase RayT
LPIETTIERHVERRRSICFIPQCGSPAFKPRAVARGFASIVPRLNLRILACSILPDHVHAVILRPERTIEQVVGFLKRAGTRQLTKEGLHPLSQFRRRNGDVPSPWIADGGWYRYLQSESEIDGAINYVEQNPLKIGMRAQRWNFVADRT